MTAESIKAIEDLARRSNAQSVIKQDDKTFISDKDGVREFVNIDKLETIELHSLKGLVTAANSNTLRRSIKTIVVETPNRVVAYGSLDAYGRRKAIAVVTPFTEPFRFGHRYDREEFIIALQSLFVDKGDREALLQFTGNLVDTNETHFQDDGITQNATVKTGASTRGEAIVPSPAKLSPFRTFAEVDQPESAFVFRVHSVDALALYEADGQAWKNEAMNNIGEYIQTNIDMNNDIVTLQ